MKLQILISQYHETDDIIKPLLDSISLQQNVDFDDISVIICSDGGEVILTDKLLNAYPFKIFYYICPHNGVSATRQACLDHATAEYVMFCDADDMFYNMCGLWIVMREMQGKGFDTMVSAFVEETRNPANGDVVYVNHDMDSTFVHGKIHRRKYLIDKNIKWNPNLTIHEDSYFNCLCQACLDSEDRGKFCSTPFYLWKWRDESVCRHDEKYLLKTYNNMLDSNTALIEELIHRGMRDKAQYYCVGMVFDAYYTMNKDDWINQENKEYRDSVSKRFAVYYNQFKDLFESADVRLRNATSAQIRNVKVAAEGMNMESMTFDEWISSILNNY